MQVIGKRVENELIIIKGKQITTINSLEETILGQLDIVGIFIGQWIPIMQTSS